MDLLVRYVVSLHTNKIQKKKKSIMLKQASFESAQSNNHIFYRPTPVLKL